LREPGPTAAENEAAGTAAFPAGIYGGDEVRLTELADRFESVLRWSFGNQVSGDLSAIARALAGEVAIHQPDTSDLLAAAKRVVEGYAEGNLALATQNLSRAIASYEKKRGANAPMGLGEDGGAK
jgi:hypothetical protein